MNITLPAFFIRVSRISLPMKAPGERTTGNRGALTISVPRLDGVFRHAIRICADVHDVGREALVTGRTAARVGYVSEISTLRRRTGFGIRSAYLTVCL